MPISSVFEYCQNINYRLVVEYFYQGEKIDHPELFFDINPGLFELAFPSPAAIKEMVNKNLLYGATHKLVISEYGFNLMFR